MIETIAAGKIAANGTIVNATPGITVSTSITPGNILSSTEVGYTLRLPKGMVDDGDYIIELTAENYSEDGPDFTLTTIAYRYQSTNGFEVLIWADRSQTMAGWATVQSDWHFVIHKNTALKAHSIS